MNNSEEKSDMVNGLSKVKENINQKQYSLKNYEANIQSSVGNIFTSIIDTLIKVSKYIDSRKCNIIEVNAGKDVVYPITKDSVVKHSFPDVEKLCNKTRFNQWFEFADRDEIYDPSKINNKYGYIVFKHKEFDFSEETVLSFEDNSYSITPGLEQLSI